MNSDPDDLSCPEEIIPKVSRETSRSRAKRRDSRRDAASSPTTTYKICMLSECLDDPAMQQPVKRIATGLVGLDRALHGGMVTGGMYVVAGATSHGKTTLGAINLLRRIAESGVKTLLITLEMNRIQVARCMLASISKLPSAQLETMELSDDETQTLARAIAVLRGLPLAIDESIAELEALCTFIKFCASRGFLVLALDQMSWVVAPGHTQHERASLISRRLKSVARETGVVLILMCQVNREGAKRDDGPELYDLRDSGTIEQDADGVLMISHVERIYNGNPARMQVRVLKHRHGPMGNQVRATLAWFMDHARIENYAGEFTQ